MPSGMTSLASIMALATLGHEAHFGGGERGFRHYSSTISKEERRKRTKLKKKNKKLRRKG